MYKYNSLIILMSQRTERDLGPVHMGKHFDRSNDVVLFNWRNVFPLTG